MNKKKVEKEGMNGQSLQRCNFLLSKAKAKHEHQFPNIGFLACQMMGIVGLQIETIKIFNMIKIINGLKCCFLVARI
jgi:hypothetical protein